MTRGSGIIDFTDGSTVGRTADRAISVVNIKRLHATPHIIDMGSIVLDPTCGSEKRHWRIEGKIRMFDCEKSSGVGIAPQTLFFLPPALRTIRISGWRGEWTNLNI